MQYKFENCACCNMDIMKEYFIVHLIKCLLNSLK